MAVLFAVTMTSAILLFAFSYFFKYNPGKSNQEASVIRDIEIHRDDERVEPSKPAPKLEESWDLFSKFPYLKRHAKEGRVNEYND